MGWPTVALLGLTTLTLVTSHHTADHLILPPVQKHIPPSSAVTFQRGSVESRPGAINPDDSKSNLESASARLPLRDAVEFIPRNGDTKSERLQEIPDILPQRLTSRTPLRDAVEHRPPPPLGNRVVSHESIWLEQLLLPAVRRNQGPPSVVCHLNSNAVYRSEPFSLYPQGIPSRKCSHIIYDSATIDPQELIVVSRDPEYDEIQGGYKAAVGLRIRDPSARILISVEFPGHGRLYAELTSDFRRTERFAQSLLLFLEKHQFDGVEINWENAPNARLKSLLKALYPRLSRGGYTVAVAVRPEDRVDPEIEVFADLLFFKAWRAAIQKYARHPAPLYLATNFVRGWLDRGADPKKIILEVPVFGRSYTLQFKNDTNAGAPVLGAGIAGPHTKFKGFFSYYEACEKLEEQWYAGRDEEGPFLKRGDQWIGYEDPISVKLKVAYIKQMNLGGVGLSSLDLDDFVGLCGNAWPMLTTATDGLGVYDVPIDRCSAEGILSDPENCAGFLVCDGGKLYRSQCGMSRFFEPSTKRCVKATPEICKPGYSLREPIDRNYLGNLRAKQQIQPLQMKQSGPRVVCYVTSWALYRKGDGKFVPEHLDTRLCTDVIYAFAGLNPDTLFIQPFDPWADIDNNLYGRITSVDGPRVLLALGGWTDSSGDKYSRLISSASARQRFIATTVNYLHMNNFDGLSLEWNYPKCWQSDCKKGPDSDRPNFTKLIQEMRRAFDNAEPQLTLAVSLSGYKEVIDRAYDVKEISEAADFITVMTYDYHGAWESRTGHLAPLYGRPGDSNPHYNLNFTMNYLVTLGASRSKLTPGIPFYGQSYRLASPNRSKLNDPASGPGSPGEFTQQPGMLGYYEICYNIKRRGWSIGEGPSARSKDQFVAFDDVTSIAEKGAWILQNGYGGVSAWTIDLDDFVNRCCLEPFPLLRSLNRALGRLLDPAPIDENCERPSEPVTPLTPTMTTHSDADDGLHRPTRPMASSTTTKATTWPTWTERPSNKPQSTGTTWPTWTWSSTTTTAVRPTKWTTTTQKPLNNNETPAPGLPCNSGDHSPDPSNCGNYFRCVLGEYRREYCAPGLHWDERRRLCDWPAAAKCQHVTDFVTTPKPQPTHKPVTQRPTATQTWTMPSTTRPTRPPTRPTTHKPVHIGGPKECAHGQYYAYPQSCSHFLICVNDNLIIQQCGPGLNWNDEKKMCDWAFKNPCKDKPNKNSPLVMMKEMSTNEPCIPGSFSGVPGDCESYQACLWGRHEKFSCAPGLHFNKETHICDWPARAKCKEEPVYTERPPAAASTTYRPHKPVKKPVTTTTQQPWTEKPKPLPKPEIDPSKVSPLSGYFKVVCYFTNWAWYRRGIGKYTPENIDHTLCTHIIYGFAVLDYSELTIKAHDSWADYDNRFYERVVAYKKRGLKVLLAIGGWNDSAGDKYSRLVNSPSARQKFIEHVIQFVEKYGFDGLDLDWEYPVCWQVDCKKGPASDKEGFASLLRELKAQFKPRGLLLSAAVSPSKTVIDKGYDVPALAKYLDWISVMTYDYHGQWDKKTGHVAPLYYHESDDVYFFNANYSINYWIAKGAPPRSIVMGMPLYGQAFSIHDPSAGTALNAPAGAGLAGEFTQAAGFLAYYEICDRIKNHGWKVYQDPQRRMGPYAYKGSQWVSFDDADMIRQKAQFVRDMNLGGGMVWALDLDDFRGRCGQGEHPLMHTLQQVLAEPPSKHDRPIKPPSYGQDLEWKPAAPPKKMPELGSDRVQDRESEFKVVCYFTNWAWYRQEGGRFVPEDIDADLCTHVIYGFAVLDGSTLTIKTHDSWADIDNKFYERVVAYKSKGIRVLLAIGGWNDSAGDKYSRLVNSPSARSRFITHVVQFIEKYGFEGLDLDWEYPVCWQVDCNKGPASDKASFTMFVKELSAVFKPKGLLLSSAVSPSKRVISAGYDVPELSKYLDWISVMTYDFHGQWDKKTGHVAPLYVRPDDWEPTFNANFSINYWIEQGASPKKLVMGAPLYGQSFSLAERNQRGLNAPTYGGGEAGEATRARGFLAYYEICERTLKKGWTVVQDPQRRIGPYAYHSDQWVSFDDAEQIKLKSEFIKKMGLGGGMVWALDLDDFKNRCGCEPSPLLRTMNRVLRNYPPGPTCTVTGSKSPLTPPEGSTQKPTQAPVSVTTQQEHSTSSPSYLEPTVDTDDSVEIIAVLPPSTSVPIRECEGRMFMPHKYDCSKYLICNFGQPQEFTCPNGLHWNNDRCDWPENAKCKKKLEITNEIPQVPEDTERPILGEISVKPTTSRPIIEDIDRGDKKVICYFTNWAWYRPGDGKYLPENIDANLCTHIIYGFTVLDYETLTIKMHDSWADIDNNFYGRITAYKSKGIKVLVALGGWNDSAGDKYSRLVNDPSARNRFIRHAIQFINKYNFDGLDLDWEYPVCWQVNCERGPPSDKKAFATFVQELSAEFRPRGLLLSAAVSPSKRVIDRGYDVPALGKYLDWIAVMTYDFHGNWEKKTGHVAPLYYYPGDEFDYFNANFSMRYWIEKGAPPSKLVMGVPLYGQSFTLSNREISGQQAPAVGPGHAGPFTRAAGFLSFYEICDNARSQQWTIVKDEEGRIGPYIVKDDQWVGYDDVTSVLRKAAFIRELDLAGGMIWALDLDDFTGNCGCGKYPLLTALNAGLKGESIYGKDCT